MKKKVFALICSSLLFVFTTIPVNAQTNANSHYNKKVNTILMAPQAPNIVWWTESFPLDIPAEIQDKAISEQLYLDINININFPHFSGLENKEIQRKINNTIETYFLNEIADFEEHLVGYEAFDGLFISFYDKYQVKFCNESLISVYFIGYQQIGGPHGNRRDFAMNFDGATGELLELGDLFWVTDDFTKLIYDQCEFLQADETCDYYEPPYGEWEYFTNFIRQSWPKGESFFYFDTEGNLYLQLKGEVGSRFWGPQAKIQLIDLIAYFR